ncbi:MAG: carboxypeptidase regulatory-like domain-containing protein [candidate division WOR-3 bacterium]|nr:carboxypeptidase regulatory-like domain-containing protein [candidate division WOR-3 bacterium]MCX7947772.1 carboxypeptidase regulatory-like domain-containing protein [candidate division WOR-3 bacterium]MDW8150304.1 carboxypeptidase regulatory-like domain-containing protein [candidate division WOR-3 bacterium]
MLTFILINQVETYLYGLNYEALTGTRRVGSAFVDGINALTFHLINLNYEYSASNYILNGKTGKPFIGSQFFGFGYSLAPFEASVIMKYFGDAFDIEGEGWYLGYGLGDVKTNFKVGIPIVKNTFAVGFRGYINIPVGEEKYVNPSSFDKDTISGVPFATQDPTGGKGGIYRPFAYKVLSYGLGGAVSLQRYPLRLNIEAVYNVGDTVRDDEFWQIGAGLLAHVGIVKPYAEFVYLKPIGDRFADSSANLLTFGIKFGYPYWHFDIALEKPLNYSAGPYGSDYVGVGLISFKPDWSVWASFNFTYEAGIPRVKYGDVIAIVQDAQNNAPIPNASINIKLEKTTLSQTTDQFGKFEFKKIPAGTYTIEVSARDYQPEVRTISIVEGKNEVRILLSKIKKGSISVRIFDSETKAPLSALVSLFKDNVKISEDRSNEQTGTITFKELEPGTYSFRVEKEGYNTTVRTVELKESAIEEVGLVKIKVEAPKFVKLTGKISDAKTNAPISGAQVIASGKSAVSDQFGLYTIDSLPLGVIQLGVSKEGYQTYSEVVQANVEGAIVKNITLTPIEEKPKTGRVVVSVIDRETKKPVISNITIPGTNISGITDNNGSYSFEIGPGEYALNIQPQDQSYYAQVKQVSVKIGETVTILAELVKKQARIVVRNIYFDLNKATIRPESYPVLDELCQLLKETPTATIEVEGHTDTRGSDEYNLRLSQSRADAVRDYFVNKGCISIDRIKSIGYGETRPSVFPEKNENDYQMNRRVEIKFVGEK